MGWDQALLDAARGAHLLAPVSVQVLFAEHLGRLFLDELFEDLFGSDRVRSPAPVEMVAVVIVPQALEGVSADADRCGAESCGEVDIDRCGTSLHYADVEI